MASRQNKPLLPRAPSQPANMAAAQQYQQHQHQQQHQLQLQEQQQMAAQFHHQQQQQQRGPSPYLTPPMSRTNSGASTSNIAYGHQFQQPTWPQFEPQGQQQTNPQFLHISQHAWFQDQRGHVYHQNPAAMFAVGVMDTNGNIACRTQPWEPRMVHSFMQLEEFKGVLDAARNQAASQTKQQYDRLVMEYGENYKKIVESNKSLQKEQEGLVKNNNKMAETLSKATRFVNDLKAPIPRFNGKSKLAAIHDLETGVAATAEEKKEWEREKAETESKHSEEKKKLEGEIEQLKKKAAGLQERLAPFLEAVQEVKKIENGSKMEELKRTYESAWQEVPDESHLKALDRYQPTAEEQVFQTLGGKTYRWAIAAKLQQDQWKREEAAEANRIAEERREAEAAKAREEAERKQAEIRRQKQENREKLKERREKDRKDRQEEEKERKRQEKEKAKEEARLRRERFNEKSRKRSLGLPVSDSEDEGEGTQQISNEDWDAAWDEATGNTAEKQWSEGEMDLFCGEVTSDEEESDSEDDEEEKNKVDNDNPKKRARVGTEEENPSKKQRLSNGSSNSYYTNQEEVPEWRRGDEDSEEESEEE